VLVVCVFLAFGTCHFRWERTPSALPASSQWPTWGVLRERILTACEEIIITYTDACTDEFVDELVKLSPPSLHKLELRGNNQLTSIQLSSPSLCPSLATFDLSWCASLAFVFVQSDSLHELKLDECSSLSKIIVHAPLLSNFSCSNCCKLDRILLWSDVLQQADMSGCGTVTKCQLHCPELDSSESSIPKETKAENRGVLRREPISEVLANEHGKQVEEHVDKRRHMKGTPTSRPPFPSRA